MYTNHNAAMLATYGLDKVTLYLNCKQEAEKKQLRQLMAFNGVTALDPA